MNPRFWLGIVLLLATAATFAGPRASSKKIELSMLVSGTLEVDAQGRVERFSLDQPNKLSPGVVGVLQRAIPDWRFEPVVIDGKAVPVATDFSARMFARKADKDIFSVWIGGVAFGYRTGKASERLDWQVQTAPSYPKAAERSGVAGTVYLLVRANGEGQVTDALAEQVNLRIIGNEGKMERWRKVLARAAEQQALRWRFRTPTEGPDADEDNWVLRVPVVFHMGEPQPYGSWEAYVRGPREPNPWSEDNEGMAFAPDALTDGQLHPIGSGLKMTTPLPDG